MNDFEKWLKNELEIIKEHYTEYVGDKDVQYLSMCIVKGEEEEELVKDIDNKFYISANNRHWEEDKETPVNINFFVD